MATASMTPGVQRVLESPRGRRFGRPGENPMTREQRILAQMRGNPRVEHRLRHGELPAWMKQRPEPDPRPPRLEPRQPGRRGAHRKPRRVFGWRLASYALATSTGLLIGQLVGLT